MNAVEEVANSADVSEAVIESAQNVSAQPLQGLQKAQSKCIELTKRLGTQENLALPKTAKLALDLLKSEAVCIQLSLLSLNDSLKYARDEDDVSAIIPEIYAVKFHEDDTGLDHAFQCDSTVPGQPVTCALCNEELMGKLFDYSRQQQEV